MNIVEASTSKQITENDYQNYCMNLIDRVNSNKQELDRYHSQIPSG